MRCGEGLTGLKAGVGQEGADGDCVVLEELREVPLLGMDWQFRV